MSRDEKDLPLGDISQINVDEAPKPMASPKQPVASETKKVKPPTLTAQVPPAAKVVKNTSSTRGLWGLVLLLLLLLIGLAAAGWVFYQQLEQVKTQLDHELSQSDQRLGTLATELSSTGENVSSNIGALQRTTDTLMKNHLSLEAEQKKQMDEIRKLWDISNKRNKALIDENQKAIKAAQTELAAQKKAAVALTAELKKAQQQALDGAKRAEAAEQKVVAATNKQTQLEMQLELASETQKHLQAQLKEQEKVVKPLAEALPALKELAKLQHGEKTLGVRINALEDAMNAFDMYRRQVNQRLEALE